MENKSSGQKRMGICWNTSQGQTWRAVVKQEEEEEEEKWEEERRWIKNKMKIKKRRGRNVCVNGHRMSTAMHVTCWNSSKYDSLYPCTLQLFQCSRALSLTVACSSAWHLCAFLPCWTAIFMLFPFTDFYLKMSSQNQWSWCTKCCAFLYIYPTWR
jgi:hypothetical protein